MGVCEPFTLNVRRSTTRQRSDVLLNHCNFELRVVIELKLLKGRLSSIQSDLD